MPDATHHCRRAARAARLLVLAIAALLAFAPGALAISAPIHISGTDGEGVLLRPEPNTSRPAVGWMPEGASPDYNCFAWGQDIEGVPIWFSVNYNGVTGWYASFYDDSHYQSNEELTAKYGVPLCGSAPSASSPSPAAPPSSPAAPPSSPAPSPAPASGSQGGSSAPLAAYFSPYEKGASNGQFEVGDGLTKTLYRREWESHCESSASDPGRPYRAAIAGAGSRPITTLAGWSVGRIGVISYLANATSAQLRQLHYVLLIDPGYYGQMNCDRERNAGGAIVHWLGANTTAHLVVISSTEITQQENSRGIQDSYFDAVRAAGGNLSQRVLVCNYFLPNDGNEAGHDTAFWTSRYWIQHEIGSIAGLVKNSCPQLSLNGSRWNASAGWHP